MEQDALGVGHAGEAGPVGHAAVQVGASVDPDRLKEDRHRARGLERRSERPAAENAHAPREHVEDGDGQRDAALVERLDRQEGVEQPAEQVSAEEPRADARIPEALAAEAEDRPCGIRGRDTGGPRARDQRPGARAGDRGGDKPLVLEHRQHARVGEEAEEPGGHREPNGASRSQSASVIADEEPGRSVIAPLPELARDTSIAGPRPHTLRRAPASCQPDA